FVQRAGQTAPRGPPAGGLTLATGTESGEGGAGESAAPDPSFLGQLGQLLRPPSMRGSGGGGGGGGGGGFGALGFIAQAFGRAGGGGGGVGGGGLGALGCGGEAVCSGYYLFSVTLHV